MSGLTLQAILQGLAAQITANIDRSTSVFPNDPGSHAYPAVVLEPADDYVAYFGTMGPNGISDVLIDALIEVSATQRASALKAMNDYLSAGTGNNSSIVDAIHRDRTLSGLVADCVCLTADGPRFDDAGLLATRLHVQIMVSKQNAEVG